MGAAEKFACAVALAVFAGGAIGLILQRLLPDEFTTGGPRDMIGAVVGLLTLLSALVLGLLIWTAFGVYSGQNLAVQTLAAKVLQLDLALTDYGPEASGGRALLRQELAKTLDAIWNANLSDSEFAAAQSSPRRSTICAIRTALLKSLDPSTDEAEAGAWRRRGRRSIRSASPGCRCRLRFTAPFPTRWSMSWSAGGWRSFAASA